VFTAYVIVTCLAIAFNGLSGIGAIVHLKSIIPPMAKAGVPESWLTFPIGTAKSSRRSRTTARAQARRPPIQSQARSR
jgi:hypothetical protein